MTRFTSAAITKIPSSRRRRQRAHPSRKNQSSDKKSRQINRLERIPIVKAYQLLRHSLSRASWLEALSPRPKTPLIADLALARVRASSRSRLLLTAVHDGDPKGQVVDASEEETTEKSAERPRKFWSDEVTRTSNALDLEAGVFTWRSPRKIARSLKRSAEASLRRRADPFRSAMSMLTFFVNRAGKNLSSERRRVLERAKDELRREFGRPTQEE